MSVFATVRDSTVYNIIVADTPEIAAAVCPGDEIVACTDGRPGIGWVRDDQGWKNPAPAPYPSWSWNYAVMEWESPAPKPTDADKDYYWDEDAQEWRESVPPPHDDEE